MRQRKISFKVKVDDAPKGLEFDADDIGVIIRNLVQNSIRSLTRKTHVRRKIEVLVRVVRSPERPSEAAVNIMIEDNGVGIDPEILDRVFEPEFTTYRGIGGRGHGLAWVERVCKKHGTVPLVESEWGHWCRVNVELIGKVG